MAYGYDQNQEASGVDFVDDAIVPDPNSPGLSAVELLDAVGSRVIRQAADGTDDSLLVRSRDPRKRPLRSPFDEEAVSQSLPPAWISRIACSKGTGSEGWAFAAS